MRHFAVILALIAATQTGHPATSLATSLDGHYVPGFGYPLPGLDGYGRCAIEYSGELICAGTFDLAGNVLALNIARWDGAQWHSMSDGTVYGAATSFAVYHGDLIAAGTFEFTDGGTNFGLARWDGAQWQPFGTDSNYGARVVVASGDSLFVGGSFSSMGGVPAQNIALWNGSAWSALGGGLPSYPNILTMYHGSVAAGGWFYVLRWNGSSWIDIAPGVYGDVWALGVQGDRLIAGGNIFRIGTTLINYIASFDGTQWSSLGSGLDGPASGVIVQGNDVIVAGIYQSAGGVPAHNIARWDGTSWHPLGDGCDGGLNGVASFGSGLVAVGDFRSAGDAPARSIARWDGSGWSALGTEGLGTDGGINAFADYNGELIAGGGVSNAGGMQPANGIARWNGTAWQSLGGGLHTGPRAGVVSGMVVFDGRLYVVGAFDHAGSVAATNIASWDGTAWSPVAGGTDGSINAIAIYNGHLVVGGNFNRAGANAATRIAILNTGGWNALGSGMYRNDLMGNNIASVVAVAVHGGDLIAAGGFDQAGGVDATNIARWNGSAWSPIGGGVGHSGQYGDEARALASRNGVLYAGGSFNTAGGVPAVGLAAWDGVAWSPVGGSTDGYVNCLFVTNDGVVAGGRFGYAGGIAAADVAFWNGQAWSTFGGGVTNAVPGLFHDVNAVGIFGGDMFFGGEFTRADTTASSDIAQWRSGTAGVGNGVIAAAPCVHVPNPYWPGAVIRVEAVGTAAGDVVATGAAPGIRAGIAVAQERRVEILDLQGRRVRDLAISASGETTWDGRTEGGRDAAAGIYFIRMRLGDSSWVRKIMLERQ
jgi:hypothetical protein